MSETLTYTMTFTVRHPNTIWTDEAAASTIGHTAPVTEGDDGPTLAIGTVLAARPVEDGDALEITMELSEPLPL